MDNKPGIKTTEFWVGTLTPVLVPIILAVTNKYGIALPEEVVNTVVTASIMAPITYILGRIYGKKKQADIEIQKEKNKNANN